MPSCTPSLHRSHSIWRPEEFEAIDAVLEVYAKRSTGELAFRSIAVLDMNGVVVAHSDPRVRQEARLHLRTDRDGLSPLAVHPRGDEGGTGTAGIDAGHLWPALGTIVADTPLSGLDDRVVANQLKVLVSTFLIACSTAVLIWILLSRMVFLPLEAIARTSRAIGGVTSAPDSTYPTQETSWPCLEEPSTKWQTASKVTLHASRLQCKFGRASWKMPTHPWPR